MAEISELDALDALAEFFRDEQRLPDDIDAVQIAEKFGLRPHRARQKMHNLIEQFPDTWQCLEVRDNGKRILVIRKRH